MLHSFRALLVYCLSNTAPPGIPLWMVPEVTEVIDMGVSIAYSNSWMVCFMENPSIDGR